MVSILAYNLQELRDLFKSMGMESYRADQVTNWLYKKFQTRFENMTNLSKSQREFLSSHFKVDVLELVTVMEAGDSLKYLFRTEDGHMLETVLIFERDHLTICLSSQVGCAVGCRFCATARDGLIRNLTTEEIVDQFLQVQKRTHQKIRNVVFMGMGEPLANYEAVRKAVEILLSPWGLDISKRRLSISTSGLLAQIRRMAQDNLLREVNLAVSINAPRQTLRESIMPISKTNTLDELIQTLVHFPCPPDRRIMLEYVLIKGVNDSEVDAQQLAQLLFPYRRRFKINLIPYNPDPTLPYERPSLERVYAFQEILRKKGLSVFIRLSKGVEVFGACGQLRSKRLQTVIK